MPLARLITISPSNFRLLLLLLLHVRLVVTFVTVDCSEKSARGVKQETFGMSLATSCTWPHTYGFGLTDQTVRKIKFML